MEGRGALREGLNDLATQAAHGLRNFFRSGFQDHRNKGRPQGASRRVQIQRPSPDYRRSIPALEKRLEPSGGFQSLSMEGRASRGEGLSLDRGIRRVEDRAG